MRSRGRSYLEGGQCRRTHTRTQADRHTDGNTHTYTQQMSVGQQARLTETRQEEASTEVLRRSRTSRLLLAAFRGSTRRLCGIAKRKNNSSAGSPPALLTLGRAAAEPQGSEAGPALDAQGSLFLTGGTEDGAPHGSTGAAALGAEPVWADTEEPPLWRKGRSWRVISGRSKRHTHAGN